MKKLDGTKTLKNLEEAFAGESMARNKYSYYANMAKKEGMNQIADILLETADNEKEHAKLWFKLIHEGVKTTTENLLDAAEGEHYENARMYRRMERVARAEGFDQIANLFKKVGEIEKEHEKRYIKLRENVLNKTVFKKDKEVEWKCGNCGRIIKGQSAPEICDTCSHQQAYFQVNCKNYR